MEVHRSPVERRSTLAMAEMHGVNCEDALGQN
jgi:hypothetical protein